MKAGITIDFTYIWVLTGLLILLKLLFIPSLSWWVVFSPLWLPMCLLWGFIGLLFVLMVCTISIILIKEILTK